MNGGRRTALKPRHTLLYRHELDLESSGLAEEAFLVVKERGREGWMNAVVRQPYPSRSESSLELLLENITSIQI